MSLEPGGYADKIGNRYEGRWVVRQLLRLLLEELSSVQLQVVGDEEYGVDLWVQRPDGSRVAQQCKIRNGSYDRWTVADLSQRDILDAMRTHLDAQEENDFMLVTAVSSAVIQGICQSARHSEGDPESFFRHQIQELGEPRRKAFRQFCERLGLSAAVEADRAQAYSYLRRFSIETWPDGTTERENLLDQAGMLVTGDPTVTVALLADYAVDQIRQVIDASKVWAHLESCGLHPRSLSHDDRVVPAIRALQEQFASSVEPYLINGAVIPRTATDDLCSALDEHAIVALHGNPGQGKSGVLYELSQRLASADVAYLPIRLDRQVPQNNTRAFGESLGLPESPVACLRAAAGDRKSVLILDQLDALRWTSHHSVGALEVCKALVREVRGHRQLGTDMRVVLACRSYDIENDPEIKKWMDAEKRRGGDLKRVAVGDLAPEAVDGAVAGAGCDASSLSSRQKEMLASPQHLAMWLQIMESSAPFEFQSRVQLMREYWTARMQEMTKGGAGVSETQATLDVVVGFMESNGSLSAPAAVVPNSVGLDALLAAGILRISNSTISFSHQSYLDYQIASRVVREIYSSSKTIVEWLGPRDAQSLFRREQLRQALCLLAEEEGGAFDSSANELLDSKEVRFHLKHLCLEVVGQLDTPSDELITALLARTEDSNWDEHLLITVFRGHSAFVRPLVERGILSDWLDSEQRRNSALWLLRSVAETIPDHVVAAVEPFADNDDWREDILGCLAWNAKDDSDAMFALRLRLARAGVYRDFVDWQHLQADRRLALLDAALESATPDIFNEQVGRRSRRSRFEHWSDADLRALLESARAHPSNAWAMAIAQIQRLAPVGDEPYGRLQQWLDSDREELHQGMEGIPHGVTAIARAAGACLAETDGDAYWAATDSLRALDSPVIQNVLVETYASLPAHLADRALEWLTADDSRLSLGTGRYEPKWMPARRLIETLAPHCTSAVLERLEQSIRSYHTPTEKRDAEYWLKTWKDGYFGDYWGRCQHFLLPAIPAERRSEQTEQLIGVLARKFEHYARDRFLSSPRSMGGYVSSTLSDDGARISDEAWLGIVSNEAVSEDGSGRWRQTGKGRLAESSIRQFSRNLEQAAKRFPERFARLALRFPPGVHHLYKAAILDALKLTKATSVPEDEQALWEPAPSALVEDVLARFGTDESRAFASSFCWLLHARAEDDWSDAALNRLVTFATTHADPKVDQLAVTNADGDFSAARATPESLATNANNCVRGVAGFAIGSILRHHPAELERMRPAIDGLCNDGHPTVRVAAIETCLPLLAKHKDLAMECFRQACEPDPRVSAAHRAVYFFNCGMESHAELLSPLIVAMLRSDMAEVAREGAKEVAARWVFGRHFDAELAECLAGTVPQRRGVAQIAQYLVTKPEYFEACEPMVSKLMDDPDAEVRSGLRGLVRSQEIFLTPRGIDLVRRFVESPAFRDDPTGLLYGLDEHTGDLVPFAAVIFTAVDQFVGPLLEASRDMSLGVQMDVGHINRLLLRLYEQADAANDTEITNRCLDAWDAMFQHRVGGVRDLAKEIE